ncbi:MAG: hypothetical protein EBX53_08915, partial [Betaproteobacteria bacterium]|nr:hypothetical protein [Betaproteobacteria bacterium]
MKPAIDHAADGDAPITYRIEPFDPKGHRFRVGLLIRTQALAQDKVLLRLAAWIPGSYMIREFAKHVLSNLPPLFELAKKLEEHAKGMVVP